MAHSCPHLQCSTIRSEIYRMQRCNEGGLLMLGWGEMWVEDVLIDTWELWKRQKPQEGTTGLFICIQMYPITLRGKRKLWKAVTNGNISNGRGKFLGSTLLLNCSRFKIPSLSLSLCMSVCLSVYLATYTHSSVYVCIIEILPLTDNYHLGK